MDMVWIFLIIISSFHIVLQVFREEGLLVQMQCALVVHLKQTAVLIFEILISMV